MYISHGKDKDNLVKNQEVLQLVIISKNLMTFIVDIVVILKREIRCQALLGFQELIFYNRGLNIHSKPIKIASTINPPSLIGISLPLPLPLPPNPPKKQTNSANSISIVIHLG